MNISVLDTPIQVPVPTARTTKIKNLDSNIESVKVKLTKEDLKEITDAIPIHEVAGGTYPEGNCSH
ncbi:Perakine reductase [Gossypium arboreum]|uniref:Perakine reductase n=1 Tax=Gossypium arboreum TaxID=29729 RepID=A0A0B0PQV5_GOSAR|nr:Perakine reductase [Gossypium arboreum]